MKGTQTLRRELFLRRGLNLIAHALDHVTKDTLDGVTFKLVERPAETLTAQLLNRPGEKFPSSRMKKRGCSMLPNRTICLILWPLAV
jgi:hypothetical protein